MIKALADARVILYHRTYLPKEYANVSNPTRHLFIDWSPSNIRDLEAWLMQEDECINSVPIKRTFEAIDGLPDEINTVPPLQRVICVNTQLLTALLQNRMVRNYVRTVYDNVAADIVDVILSSDVSERTPESYVSQTTQFNYILKKLPSMKSDEIRGYLYMLTREQYGVALVKTSELQGTGAYYVDLNVAFKELAVSCFIYLCELRRGKTAVRICNALFDKKFLTQKQLSELCLIRMQQVQSTVQSLLKDGLIEMKIIPVGVETRPSNSCALVTIDINSVLSTLTFLCTRILIGLTQTRTKIEGENSEILHKGSEIDEAIDAIEKCASSATIQEDTQKRLADLFVSLAPSERTKYDELKSLIEGREELTLKVAENLFMLTSYRTLVSR